MKLALNYPRGAFRQDVVAALTVAAISVPQGMAYALLAGVDPRFGLYSAIVVTAVASGFGSSSHLINGPTSAISLVVLTALAGFDPDQRVEGEAMFLLGVLAGSIQIGIAVLRLGDLTRYISESVILGFMTAAALLLAVGQVGTSLGLREQGSGAQHILYRLWLTLLHGDPINPKAVAVTAVTVLFAILARYIVRRYKWPQFDMFAVLTVIAASAYLVGWTIPDATGKTAIGIAGTIPRGLPAPHVPTVRLEWIGTLAPDGLAIAFLGLLEALAIAKSISNETKQKLDYNRQCLAEGLANLTGGFFRCLPGSGSLSRSAINFQSGAATRCSGILTAGLVALAVVLFAPLARYVPKPALSALLLLTAARLLDFARIAHTLHASRMDALVVAVTATAALAFGLDHAILIGVALSIMLFVPRAAKLKAVELVVDAGNVVRDRLPSDPDVPGMLIYDLEGELFFGAAPELEQTFERILGRARQRGVRHVLVRLKRVRNPDIVSLDQLFEFLKRAAAADLVVWLAGVRPDLLAALHRLHCEPWLPQYNVLPQGADDDSATLAAIRRIRMSLHAIPDTAETTLFYQV